MKQFAIQISADKAFGQIKGYITAESLADAAKSREYMLVCSSLGSDGLVLFNRSQDEITTVIPKELAATLIYNVKLVERNE